MDPNLIIFRLEQEIERLRAALTSVRAEIDLRKAPKLMAKIEAALGISPNQQSGIEK